MTRVQEMLKSKSSLITFPERDSWMFFFY